MPFVDQHLSDEPVIIAVLEQALMRPLVGWSPFSERKPGRAPIVERCLELEYDLVIGRLRDATETSKVGQRHIHINVSACHDVESCKHVSILL